MGPAIRAGGQFFERITQARQVQEGRERIRFPQLVKICKSKRFKIAATLSAWRFRFASFDFLLP